MEKNRRYDLLRHATTGQACMYVLQCSRWVTMIECDPQVDDMDGKRGVKERLEYLQLALLLSVSPFLILAFAGKPWLFPCPLR